MAITAEKNNEANKRISEWVNYSSENHPYEQVRERAILDSMIDYKAFCSADQLKMTKGYSDHTLCYAYLSKHQRFTEDQIEEMAVITSPLFPLMGFSETDKDSMKAAIRIIQIGPRNIEEQKKEIKQILAESDKEENLSDSYMRFLLQIKELISKKNGISSLGIIDRLDWRDIFKYQDISSEFYKRWKNCINIRDTTPAGKTKSYHTTSIIQGRRDRARRRGKR